MLMTDSQQPDGYLTEERKKADPDHGFSTFFSETGTFTANSAFTQECADIE